MRTLEELFVREFKDSVKVVGNKDIYSLPLPKECESWSVSGTDEFMIKGVEDDCFSKLNNTIVKRVPKGYVAKRRVIDKAKRSYKTNDDGSFVYEDYQVPAGSLAVISNKNIELPYKRYIKPTGGFGYIDYIDYQGTICYVYTIPKEYLYKINQTALAISVKNMKNYSSIGFLTWDSGVIYIHVIPYSSTSKYTGTRILRTGRSTDYNKEVHLISDFWQSIGIIPNIELSNLQSGENLSIKSTVVGFEEYSPLEPNPISHSNILGLEGMYNESIKKQNQEF